MSVTAVIAVYGAVLSTVVLLREVWKSKRRVRVRLDYVDFLEIAEVTVTNDGYRPVAVTGITVHPDGGDMVPSNSLLSERHEPTRRLPATLNDGEHVTLPLSDAVSRILASNGMKTYIGVHTAGGKTYAKHETGLRNPKWGYFER